MSASAAIAGSLLRQAFGGQARRSPSQRTARARIGVSRLRVAVSLRDCAISSLDPSALLGVEPERGRRLDCAWDPELVEWATNRYE